MIEFTAAQRNAVGLHSLDKDACVVAGPGSGKTTVLIERFRGLVESGVPPARILAITFTEKATNQMRDRLTAAFAGRADLAGQMQRAWVSTVHGFCARLLRENAILAGVDPRFRVLADQEALALEEKSAVDALDEFLAASPGPVRALLGALHAPDLAESMLQVYDAMRAAGLRVAGLASYRPASGAREAVDALASVGVNLAPGSEWSAAQRDALAQVADLAAQLRARSGQPIAREDFEILAALEKSNLNKLRKNNTTYDLVRQIRKELIPAAEPLLAAAFHAAHRGTLLEAIARFDRMYRARKSAQSAADFSDLEEGAVRLLEENPEARDRIRRQFDHILMDEFQDTNGLQSRLLDLLRAAGRFYAVGDINQSIYGFRHADPQVFRGYRQGVEARGEHLAELRENWRSRPEILRAVSSLVAGAGGIEPHALVPVRAFRRKQQPSVEVIRCLGDAALEAAWVAARIVELQGTLPLESGAARFGDMAALVRKADSIAPLTRAFDEAGVPYVVTAGKGFFEARAVTDLWRLLRVLASPLDRISLAAVLRSPLVGASDAALLNLQESSWDLAASDSPAVRDFGRELTRWRAWRHHVSIDRLLIRAMDRSGYELSLAPREQANVEKFLNLVREAGARRSLDELVEDLERLRDADPREADSQADDVGDAVRVLTVHSAKGLEFPVVFLPALDAGVDNKPAPLLLSPALGLGVRWSNPATGRSAKDSLYEAIEAEWKARQAAESNRLLYVAMTRAEEHLVLSCSGKGKLANWAGYLESSWGLNLSTPWDGPREQRIGDFTARAICADRPPMPSAQLSLPFEPEAPERVSPAIAAGQYDSAAAVTSVALFADCPRRYYLSRYLGQEPGRRAVPIDDDTQRDNLDATEFGLQVHALLAGAAPGGAHPDALALSRRFAASSLGGDVARATRIEREFDFLLAVEDVVLRGQIDLWFDDTIIDYKTDDVSASEAPFRAESYALQLQLYALAIQRLTGAPPRRALLYFLRPDAVVPVDLSPEALADAARAVGSFRDAQDSLDFPLREAPRCARCPYFRGLCPASTFG